ncbi:EAL domain-containing protein [Salmonella enterica subsp. enterica serovar Javiana]|nr:EAL domain-containing protein [Salmonella enterica subsp. enterica serovar Javiana]
MVKLLSYDDTVLAIKNGRMVPYFQTVHCAEDRICSGVEVLTRIIDPEYGIISPGAFLSILESQELALSATECVMTEAIRVLNNLHPSLPKDFRVSFNVGAVLLSSAGFSELCCKLISRLGNGMTLCAELTERQPFYHDEEEKMYIRDLRRAGIKVVLDDFGSGHSGILMLSRYDIDGIKIPRELIDTDPADSKSDIIERHIINLAQSLNLEITAEGVISPAQYCRLKSRGVNFMQGYWFSEPVDAGAFKTKWTGKREDTV